MEWVETTAETIEEAKSLALDQLGVDESDAEFEILEEPRAGLFGRTRVHRRDATDLGVRPGADGPPFGMAFLDPPYAKGLGEAALARLAAGGWLAPEAVVVFERGSAEPAFSVEGFEPLDVRDYGAAKVHFLRFVGQS